MSCCKRSKVRARVEHVFAQQSNRLVRTIGQAKAEVKIGLSSESGALGMGTGESFQACSLEKVVIKGIIYFNP